MKLQAVLVDNDEESLSFELIEDGSIDGEVFEYCYFDEDGQICMTEFKAGECIAVYDTTVKVKLVKLIGTNRVCKKVFDTLRPFLNRTRRKRICIVNNGQESEGKMSFFKCEMIRKLTRHGITQACGKPLKDASFDELRDEWGRFELNKKKSPNRKSEHI